MKKYLAVIVAVIAMSPFIAVIAIGLFVQPRVAAYVVPAPSPEELAADDMKRKERNLRRAYEFCRDHKISDRAVFDCVRRETM